MCPTLKRATLRSGEPSLPQNCYLTTLSRKTASQTFVGKGNVRELKHEPRSENIRPGYQSAAPLGVIDMRQSPTFKGPFVTMFPCLV